MTNIERACELLDLLEGKDLGQGDEREEAVKLLAEALDDAEARG